MERRKFFKALGAVVGTAVVAKYVDASPSEKEVEEVLEQTLKDEGFYHKKYPDTYEESFQTLRLLRDIEPNNYGEAIYIRTNDIAYVHGEIVVPVKYVEMEQSFDVRYRIIEKFNYGKIYLYKCIPYSLRTRIDKTIPAKSEIIVLGTAGYAIK